MKYRFGRPAPTGRPTVSCSDVRDYDFGMAAVRSALLWVVAGLAALLCSGRSTAPSAVPERPLLKQPLAAPTSLSGKQVDAWNRLTSRPDFKSIEILPIDKSVISTNSFALNIRGKRYILNGESKRLRNPEPWAWGIPGVIWSGKAHGAEGFLIFPDAGGIGGQFALREGEFMVLTVEGASFLVEI